MFCPKYLSFQFFCAFCFHINPSEGASPNGPEREGERGEERESVCVLERKREKSIA